MDTKYCIVNIDDQGEECPITVFVSDDGKVMAEYCLDFQCFDTQEEAEETLYDIQHRVWNYDFSNQDYIRNQEIKPENLEVVEVEFDEEYYKF